MKKTVKKLVACLLTVSVFIGWTFQTNADYDSPDPSAETVWIRGDLDGNGEVDAADITRYARLLAHLDTEAAKTWRLYDGKLIDVWTMNMTEASPSAAGLTYLARIIAGIFEDENCLMLEDAPIVTLDDLGLDEGASAPLSFNGAAALFYHTPTTFPITGDVEYEAIGSYYMANVRRGDAVVSSFFLGAPSVLIVIVDGVESVVVPAVTQYQIIGIGEHRNEGMFPCITLKRLEYKGTVEMFKANVGVEIEGETSIDRVYCSDGEVLLSELERVVWYS